MRTGINKIELYRKYGSNNKRGSGKEIEYLSNLRNKTWGNDLWGVGDGCHEMIR